MLFFFFLSRFDFLEDVVGASSAPSAGAASCSNSPLVSTASGAADVGSGSEAGAGAGAGVASGSSSRLPSTASGAVEEGSTLSVAGVISIPNPITLSSGPDSAAGAGVPSCSGAPASSTARASIGAGSCSGTSVDGCSDGCSRPDSAFSFS